MDKQENMVKPRQKAYIAGKIEGDPDYRTKFIRAENYYCLCGSLIPLNPAKLPEGMTKAWYMRMCFAMIDEADIVLFLPDWEQSQGARLEHMYAEYTGKKIIFVE